jgi:hypothetical protein
MYNTCKNEHPTLLKGLTYILQFTYPFEENNYSWNETSNYYEMDGHWLNSVAEYTNTPMSRMAISQFVYMLSFMRNPSSWLVAF